MSIRHRVCMVLAAALAMAAGGMSAAGSAPLGSAIAPVVQDTQTAQAGQVPGAEREIFGRHCSVCHGLEVVTSHGRSAEEWREVVQRMVQQNGAEISEPEREAIIQYLIATHGKEGAAPAAASPVAPKPQE